MSTALSLAILHQNPAAVERALKRGADPNDRNATGSYPIFHAVGMGNAAIVKLLLAAGARVDNVLVTRNGSPTIVHVAASALHRDAISVLLEAGLNRDVLNGGKTPLMCAAGSQKIDHPPPGKTTEELAQYRRDLITLFLQYGTDIDAQDNTGRTALLYGFKNLPVLQQLIKCGAALDTQDKGGNTALHEVCYDHLIENARSLLVAGADPNRHNKQGYTALMTAACTGQYALACLLLAQGADKSLTDRQGHTARDWATSSPQILLGDLGLHPDAPRRISIAGLRYTPLGGNDSEPGRKQVSDLLSI